MGYETPLSLNIRDQVADDGSRLAKAFSLMVRSMGQARSLTVAIARAVAAHLEPPSAGLNPDLAAEGFVTLDLQPRPAAVPRDLEHVGDRVGIS